MIYINFIFYIINLLGEYGCSEEILSIMAMLQVQNVFLRPASGQASMRCKIARRQFEV